MPVRLFMTLSIPFPTIPFAYHLSLPLCVDNTCTSCLEWRIGVITGTGCCDLDVQGVFNFLSIEFGFLRSVRIRVESEYCVSVCVCVSLCVLSL